FHRASLLRCDSWRRLFTAHEYRHERGGAQCGGDKQKENSLHAPSKLLGCGRRRNTRLSILPVTGEDGRRNKTELGIIRSMKTERAQSIQSQRSVNRTCVISLRMG